MSLWLMAVFIPAPRPAIPITRTSIFFVFIPTPIDFAVWKTQFFLLGISRLIGNVKS